MRRCKQCNKPLWNQNKSGLCTHHYNDATDKKKSIMNQKERSEKRLKEWQKKSHVSQYSFTDSLSICNKIYKERTIRTIAFTGDITIDIDAKNGFLQSIELSSIGDQLSKNDIINIRQWMKGK